MPPCHYAIASSLRYDAAITMPLLLFFMSRQLFFSISLLSMIFAAFAAFDTLPLRLRYCRFSLTFTPPLFDYPSPISPPRLHAVTDAAPASAAACLPSRHHASH